MNSSNGEFDWQGMFDKAKEPDSTSWNPTDWKKLMEMATILLKQLPQDEAEFRENVSSWVTCTNIVCRCSQHSVWKWDRDVDVDLIKCIPIEGDKITDGDWIKFLEQAGSLKTPRCNGKMWLVTLLHKLTLHGERIEAERMRSQAKAHVEAGIRVYTAVEHEVGHENAYGAANEHFDKAAKIDAETTAELVEAWSIALTLVEGKLTMLFRCAQWKRINLTLLLS